MAIAKLLLTLVSVFAQQYIATPPYPQPPTEQLREQRGLEHYVTHTATLGKTLSWTWATVQLAVLLAQSDHCPPLLAPVRDLFPAATAAGPTASTALTPAFLAGTCLTLAGGLLRAYCFHVLGPRFTFQLSIRPSHALVTDGVYGVVRHPSYTAALIMTVGWLFCLFDLRTWAADGLRGPLVTSAFVCLSITTVGVMYAGLRTRMDREDAMLEKAFGEEWRAWATKVPCRLIPGVL